MPIRNTENKNNKTTKSIKFKEDSISYRILMLLGEVGEISEESLFFYFSGTNPIVIKNKINDLKNNNYIIVSGKGKNKKDKNNIKTIRLSKPKGLDWIFTHDEELYSHYMLVTNNHSFSSTVKDSPSSTNLMRRHRIAHTIVFMKRAEVKTFYDRRVLSLENPTDALDVDYPVFYSSLELKNVDVRQRHKTEFTRFVGCLFVANCAYIIYNIDSEVSNTRWSEQGELKAKTLIHDIIAYNSRAKQWTISSLILSDKIDTVFNALKEDENSKHEFLSFFNVYNNIYALPYDSNGVAIIKNFFAKDAHTLFRELVFGSELIEASEGILDCDCDVINDDTRVLSFLSGNISRLKNLCAYAETQKNTSKKFQILCYAFQVAAVQSFCPENVKTLTL